MRAAERVTVPDVVGLPFHVGRDLATKAGVTLANSDPDGPPIGALAWPGLYYIVSQSPAAGTQLYKWDSVAVEIVSHGDANSLARRNENDDPPHLSAHATPEHEQFLDLPDDSRSAPNASP